MKLDDAAEAMTAKGKLCKKKTAKKSQQRLQHEKFKCRVSSPIQVKSVNHSMSTIIDL